MSRAVLLSLLAMLTLTGCSAGPIGSSAGSASAVGPSGTAANSRTDLETQLACRQRVNEMYDRRNRAEIYSPEAAVNTPYSASYQSGVSSRGLAAQFDYERTRVECEMNSGTGAERTEAPPVPKFKTR
jgi:hypothetical protein